MPFIPGKSKITDVFHSNDILVNNVPVALWLNPMPSPKFGGLSIPSVAEGTSIVDGNVVYNDTEDGINSLTEAEKNVSPSLATFHEDTPGQTSGPGGTSPGNQSGPLVAVPAVACTNSKYFKLSDSKMPIVGQMGYSKEQIECSWIALCTNILDKIKDAGFNFKINSAFRTLAYNRSIGSSDKSDHTIGCAVDISAGSQADNKILFKALLNKFPYSQLIFEGNWIHIAYGGYGPKGGAKTMYTYTGSSPIVAGASGEFLPGDLKA